VLAESEYTCADGKKRKGTLVVRALGNVAECQVDGEKGCLTTEDFSAFAKVERAKLLPGNVKQGVFIAGVSGTLTSAGPAECAADGEVACVSSSAFPAAAASGLASKVLTGQTVAGVAGSFVPDFPEVANVRTSDTVGGVAGTLADCALDGATGCVSTVGFPAVNLTLLAPSVLKNSVTVAGITGDYPSSMYPLAGASGTADLVSLAASTAAGSYEFFDSAGTRYTGSIADAGSVMPSATTQSFTTSLYRQFTVQGDANLTWGKILAGHSIFGVEGNQVLPAPSSVRSGTTYGQNGTGTSGTLANCAAEGSSNCVVDSGTSYRAASTTNLADKVLSTTSVAGVTGNVTLPAAASVRTSATFGVSNATSGTLADCAADGSVGCVVPSSGAIKAADTTNFTGWDIRKKRNISGTVLTFAGLPSQGKSHCRNRADTATLWNNIPSGSVPTHSPLASAGLDFFDTIDDYNNNREPSVSFLETPGRAT
jgi:hypothetical protein